MILQHLSSDNIIVNSRITIILPLCFWVSSIENSLASNAKESFSSTPQASISSVEKEKAQVIKNSQNTSYRFIPASEAILEFSLKQTTSSFDSWKAERYLNESLVLVHDGDLRLDHDLVLDWNEEGPSFGRFVDEKVKSAGLSWPKEKRCYAFVVNGNLYVNGSILNQNGENGALLLVLGTLKAKSVVGGGSEILIKRHAEISDAVYGHYNDGILQFSGGITVPLFISEDHDSNPGKPACIEFECFDQEWSGKDVSGSETYFEYPEDDEEGERALLVPAAVRARLNSNINSWKELQQWLLQGKSVFQLGEKDQAKSRSQE